MRLKFEHALLVRTCNVFETVYPDSLVSKVVQVGSVISYFFTLLSVSWTESDVQNCPPFFL